MIYFQNERVGCEQCIRGHRAADCFHLNKTLVTIKSRGKTADKSFSIRLKIDPNPEVSKVSYEEIESKNGVQGVSKKCYHLLPSTPCYFCKVNTHGMFSISDAVLSDEENYNNFKVNIHEGQNINLVPIERTSSNFQTKLVKPVPKAHDYKRHPQESPINRVVRELSDCANVVPVFEVLQDDRDLPNPFLGDDYLKRSVGTSLSAIRTTLEHALETTCLTTGSPSFTIQNNRFGLPVDSQPTFCLTEVLPHQEKVFPNCAFKDYTISTTQNPELMPGSSNQRKPRTLIIGSSPCGCSGPIICDQHLQMIKQGTAIRRIQTVRTISKPINTGALPHQRKAY